MFDISGRIAIVTGGASGIGRAVSERLIKAGAVVTVIDAAAMSTGSDLDTRSIRADVTKAEDIQAAFERVRNESGRVDIVVNNAGIGLETGRLDALDLDAARRTLEVNLMGVMHCLRSAPGVMNDGGSIINTASAAATIGFPTYGPYVASKGAVVSLTRVAAIELGARGIRVNAVCPGTVETPMHPDEDAETRFTRRASPLGRLGRTEDLAGVFHFLASDESSFITGQAIYVDGGLSAGIAETLLDG